MSPRSQLAKWVEIAGAGLWALSILFLWMQAYGALTVAQSSSSLKWLSTVACLGIFWVARRHSRRVKP